MIRAELSFAPVRVVHSQERTSSDVAFTEPFDLLAGCEVHLLRAIADELQRDVGFTHEVPPRVRAVHHHVPQVRALFSGEALLAHLSAMAGVPLRLTASAQIGCTLNRSGRTVDSAADAWHLDAAEFSLIVLLTEPESFVGGELAMWLEDPELLWETRRSGHVPDARHIRAMKFERAGQAVFLRGREVPHCVGPIRSCTEPRLTLVCAYERSDNDSSVLDRRWRVEALRSAIEARLRRIARLVGDGPADSNEEYRLVGLLAGLDRVEL